MVPGHNGRDATSYWQNKSYEGIASYTLSPVPETLQVFFQSLLRDGAVRRIARATHARHPLQRVVDVACGVGDWTVRYSNFARQVVGIDINQAFLEEARRQPCAWRCEFASGDMRDFDTYRGADLICLGGCLMLLDDAEVDELLARITACLTPDGWLYVRATVATDARFTTACGYYRDRAEYQRLFSAHGFAIVEEASSAHLAAEELAVRCGLSPIAQRGLARAAARVYGSVRARRHGCDYLNWLLTRGAAGTRSLANR